MSRPLNNELALALAQIGEQVDHLNVPDLKQLALALMDERDRVRLELAEVLRQMQEQRSLAISSFTQLLLCARDDLSLQKPNYFETVSRLKELGHE